MSTVQNNPIHHPGDASWSPSAPAQPNTWKARLARRPLAAYFTITLGWICAYTLLAFRSIPPDMPDGLGSVPPYLMALLAFGMPSVIALALTALIDGKAGLRALLGRLGQWKVDPRSIAAAVLLPPAVYGSAYVLQYALGGPAPTIRLASLAAGVGSGLFSSLFEELGWRGMVLPRLLKRYPAFKAALLTGAGWGAWHFMLNYIGMRQYGAWMPLLSFLAGPVLLTGFTVLMTWVYQHTQGSLLAMVLFHLCITTSSIFLSPQAPSTADALRLYLALGGTVWLAAAVVIALGSFKRKTA